MHGVVVRQDQPFVALTNRQARGQPQPQWLVVRLDQLLPHNAHGQDEQAVCHQLVQHHQHNAEGLGGAAGEDGECVACRMRKRQQCKQVPPTRLGSLYTSLYHVQAARILGSGTTSQAAVQTGEAHTILLQGPCVRLRGQACTRLVLSGHFAAPVRLAVLVASRHLAEPVQ